MPADQPMDRLTTSGRRTAMSSSAASTAESGSEPFPLRATFATMICAPGAVPRILSAFAAAIPATCVPWKPPGPEEGATSASSSA